MAQHYILDTTMTCDHKLYAGGQWVNDTRQRCPACGMFLESSEPPVIEVALNHLGRHGFTEHLWNSHSLPIFRQDLVELWQKSRLTGFTTKPVRIVGWYERPRKPLPEDIPTYYRIVATSKVRLSQPKAETDECSLCGFVQYAFPNSGRLLNGMSIDPFTWDGSDLFDLPGYVFLFCSWRLAEVTLSGGFNRHIAFVRISDWEAWDEFDVKRWTPKKYDEHLEQFLKRHPEQLSQ